MRYGQYTADSGEYNAQTMILIVTSLIKDARCKAKSWRLSPRSLLSTRDKTVAMPANRSWWIPHII